MLRYSVAINGEYVARSNTYDKMLDAYVKRCRTLEKELDNDYEHNIDISGVEYRIQLIDSENRRPIRLEYLIKGDDIIYAKERKLNGIRRRLMS